MKNMFSGMAVLVTVSALSVACAAEAEDPPAYREVTGTTEAALLAGGTQGGCSNAEIREVQGLCGGAIHGCWKQDCTHTQDICSDAIWYQCVR